VLGTVLGALGHVRSCAASVRHPLISEAGPTWKHAVVGSPDPAEVYVDDNADGTVTSVSEWVVDDP